MFHDRVCEGAVGARHETPAAEFFGHHKKYLIQPLLEIEVEGVVETDNPRKGGVAALVAALSLEERPAVQKKGHVVAVPEGEPDPLRPVGAHRLSGEDEIACPVFPFDVARHVDQPRWLGQDRPPLGEEESRETWIRRSVDLVGRVGTGDFPVSDHGGICFYGGRLLEDEGVVLPEGEVRKSGGPVAWPEEADRPFAGAELQVVYDEGGGFSIAEEDARLAPLHLEPHGDPGVVGERRARRESRAGVELPAGHTVEDRRVLKGVGVEARPVRPQIEAFVVSVRLHTEGDARIGPRSGDGHVDLDDAVGEFHIFQSGDARQALPAEVGCDIRVRQIPGIVAELDGPLAGGQARGGQTRGGDWGNDEEEGEESAEREHKCPFCTGLRNVFDQNLRAAGLQKEGGAHHVIG